MIASGRLHGEHHVGELLVPPTNSWGPNWGHDGDCWLRASDLERLLATGGDACVPVARERPA